MRTAIRPGDEHLVSRELTQSLDHEQGCLLDRLRDQDNDDAGGVGDHHPLHSFDNANS